MRLTTYNGITVTTGRPASGIALHNGDEAVAGSKPGEKHHAASSETALAGKRAVIVEDEGVTQLQLRRSLTRMGLTVVGVANTGEGGIEVVLRERPDLVLMDIRMPGEIDGLEAARRILAEYDACVIMLTAYALEEYQARAREIGVCSYLLKPVVSETLVADLEEAYSHFLKH